MMYNVAIAALVGVALLHGASAATTSTPNPCVPLNPSELATAGSAILLYENAVMTNDVLELPVLVPKEFTVQSSNSFEHLSAYKDGGEEDTGADPTLREYRNAAGLESLTFSSEVPIGRQGALGPFDGRDASCFNYYVLSILDFTNYVSHSSSVIGNDNAATFEVFGQVNIYYTADVETERNGVPSTETVERKDVMTFSVSFPKQVSATFGDDEGPVRINKVPLIEPLITLQYVDLDFAAADAALLVDARVRIRTQVQRPYRVCGAAADSSSSLCGTNQVVLSLPATVSDDGSAVATLISDCGSQAQVEGVQSLCTQVWEFTFGVRADACSIDNTGYQLDANFRCDSVDSECALSDSTTVPSTSESWGVTLDGADFCPQIADSVELSATIGVFKDAGFSVAGQDFVEGDRVFVLLTASSSEASIASTTVASVSFLGSPFAAAEVWDGTTCTPAALGCNAVASNGGTNRASFDFDSAAFALPNDSAEFFQIVVTVDVAFDANPLLEQSMQVALMQKKTISGDRKTGASVQFQVTGVSDGKSTPEESGASVPFVSVAAAAVLAVPALL